MVIADNETYRDQLRFLLLGLLFETPDFFQRRLTAAEATSARTYALVSRLFSPITNSRLFQPLTQPT